MSESLQKKPQSKLNAIKLFLRQKLVELKALMHLIFVEKVVERNLLKLYATPEEIPVEVFFNVMKTENLDLLKRKKKSRIRKINLDDVWSDLLDYYYSNINPKEWDKFKASLAKKIKLLSEILTIENCVDMIRYGDEEAIEILNSIGVKTGSIKNINNAVNRKITSLNMLESKSKGSTSSEMPSFENTLAKVELYAGYQISTNGMSLERWINKVKAISEKSKIEKEYANNLKNNKNKKNRR